MSERFGLVDRKGTVPCRKCGKDVKHEEVVNKGGFPYHKECAV